MNNTHCVGCDVEFTDEVRAETRPGEESTCGMESCIQIAHLRAQLRDAKAAALRSERAERVARMMLREAWDTGRTVDNLLVAPKATRAADWLVEYEESALEFAAPADRYDFWVIVARTVLEGMESARTGMEFAEAA